MYLCIKCALAIFLVIVPLSCSTCPNECSLLPPSTVNYCPLTYSVCRTSQSWLYMDMEFPKIVQGVGLDVDRLLEAAGKEDDESHE